MIKCVAVLVTTEAGPFRGQAILLAIITTGKGSDKGEMAWAL
jgi:hypothetical protein